jgi:hypothetical protein
MKRLLLPALLLASWAHSQDAVDPFSLGREQDIAARPMALGGSYTAVANDFSALYYNTAGLSTVKRDELHLFLEQNFLQSTGQHVGFLPRSLEQQDLRIQSLGYVVSVPAERGGLTFAFGYYRPRTFSNLVGYHDALDATHGPWRYEAQGTQDHYRAGMGVEISSQVSLGLALDYVGGDEQIRIQDSGEVAYLRTYHGVSLEPALMIKITPRLRMGASLIAWERFNLNEVYEVKDVGNQEANYRVQYPFQLKLGLAYQGGDFLVAADYKVNNWSNYRYGSTDAELLEKASYRNEQIWSVGGEKVIPSLGIILRSGYTYNTLPERNFEPAHNLHRLSVGLGIILNGSFAMDAAYSYSYWEWTGSNLNLKDREQRTLLSFAYRY